MVYDSDFGHKMGGPNLFHDIRSTIAQSKKNVGLTKIAKYIQRMVIVLLTFGLLFCLIEEFYNSRVLSLQLVANAFIKLANGESWDHMWYVYAQIGLYLLTPFLRSFVLCFSKQDLQRALVVLFVLTLVVPTLSQATNQNFVTFIWVGSPVFYYLLGYFVQEHLSISNQIRAIGIISIVASLLLTSYCIIIQNDYAMYLRTPTSPFIAGYSIYIFLIIKSRFENAATVNSTVMFLSNNSFGVYLIHPLFLNILTKSFHWWELGLPPVLFELSMFIIAITCSAAMTRLLKLIPVFSRVL